MADDSWKQALGEEARADIDAAVKEQGAILKEQGAKHEEIAEMTPQAFELETRGAALEQPETMGQDLQEQGVEYQGEVSQQQIDADFSYNSNNHPSDLGANKESFLSQWETENPEQEQPNNAKETELDNREADLDEREMTQDDEGR